MFLKQANDEYSDRLFYGAWGDAYRKARYQENVWASNVMQARDQANNAALVAGLTAMHTQLSGFNMGAGNNVYSSLNNLQTNLNTVNSIMQNQERSSKAFGAIANSSTLFSSGAQTASAQLYKFASPSSGKVTDIKAGSLGELRYQFINLYRAETKNLQ